MGRDRQCLHNQKRGATESGSRLRVSYSEGLLFIDSFFRKPKQPCAKAMRSSVESALLLYDRESRYFHIRHSRGGQPPALFAGHEPEYSKVAGRVQIVRHVIPGDSRDRNVREVITQGS
jgi:hypothetical protein